MKLEPIVAALRQAFPDQELEPQAGLADETYVALAPEYVHPTVRLLRDRFDIRHLSTITGQQRGAEIELLYHLWATEGLTLRTRLPLARAELPTITDLIAGASFYEREVAEMLGVVFQGHPDPGLLFLPEGWKGRPPLLEADPGSVASGTNPTAGPDSRPLPGPPQVARGKDGRMVIPIGPQHPLLKEPLSYRVTVKGERVVDTALRIGYVHRGIERLCQERNYVQNIYLLERICGICSHIHTATYCQGVETIMGITVPHRVSI